MGLLLGIPLSNLPAAARVMAAAGDLARARARDGRADRRQAAGPRDRRRGARHLPATRAGGRGGPAGRPAHRRRHERDHRRPDRRDRRVRVHLRDARRARGSSSTSSSTSPTAPTRCAGTAAGAGSRSSPGCRRTRRRPVEIVTDDFPDISEVDAKLVALAKRRSGAILTNDFNLNRVAELQGLRVLNINSLANAVKPAVLPGEELRVRVIQEGKEARPGRRLPRRRDDDRRRGRGPVHRQGPRRRRDPRPPDGGRADDLRPAAPRLTAPGARRAAGSRPPVAVPSAADAIVVAAGASRRMGGIDKLDGPDRRPAAAGLDARGDRRRARGRADRASWSPADAVAPIARRGLAARPRSSPSSPEATAARNRSPPGWPRPGDARRPGGPQPSDRVVLVHDGGRPVGLGRARRRGRPGGGRRTAPRSRSCRSSRRSSGSTAGGSAATVDRTRARRGSDPAGRPAAVLLEALGALPGRRSTRTWTDEAALLEACRIPVHAIPGEPTNLKVTTPDDLGRAELMRCSAWDPPRIGFGEDGHPFGPGRDRSPSAGSRSTARRASTATRTATSRSTRSPTPSSARPAWATSGRIFPAGPDDPAAGSPARAPRRRSSGGSASAGLRPSPGRPDDRRRPPAARPAASRRCASAIADLLGLPPDRVNVKASTGNLAGFEGAGRGIAARAVATRRADPMTVRLLDTLTGRAARPRPARARSRPDLQLRPDRLRPGPYRQLPVVPVRRPARPAPPLARATG